MTRTMTCIAALALMTGPAFSAAHEPTSWCDRGFSSVDKDGDGMISMAEGTALRDARYEALDANKDGSIDRDEMANCDESSRANRSAMSGDAGAAFDEIDTDKSGDVSMNEYYTGSKTAYDNAMADPANAEKDWWERYLDRGSREMEGDDDMASISPEEYYSQVGTSAALADTDRSGTLSREEYSARGTNAFDRSASDSRFDEIDTDKDGNVSREEFDAMSERGMQNAQQAAERDGYYDASKGMPAAYLYMFAM